MTEKMEKFCRFYVQEHLPAYKAYQKAGYNLVEKNARSASSRLMKNPKIMQRIQELKDAEVAAFGRRSSEKRKILWDIAYNSVLPLSDRLKAIDTLNKMDGEYDHKVSVNVNSHNPYDDLTTDEIKQFLGEST